MRKPYALEMIHVRLQAVREDHKFRRSGHLMVKSWSLRHMSKCDTIPAAVGRHRSVRSIGATSLQASLHAHLLVPGPAGHILAAWTTSHVFTMQVVSYVLVLQAKSHFLVMQFVFACMSLTHWWWSIWGCRRSVRTTFEKFHRSGHLMVTSCPAALSSMCSTTLASVGWHRSMRSTEATSLHVWSEAHVLLPCADWHVSSVWAISYVFVSWIASYVLAPWAKPRVLAMQIVLHAQAFHFGDGPLKLGKSGKSCWEVLRLQNRVSYEPIDHEPEVSAHDRQPILPHDFFIGSMTRFMWPCRMLWSNL